MRRPVLDPFLLLGAWKLRRASWHPDPQRHDAAVSWWRRLAARRPDDVRAQRALGLALLQRGQALHDEESLLEAEDALARHCSGEAISLMGRANAAHLLGALRADEQRLAEAVQLCRAARAAPGADGPVEAYAWATEAVALLSLAALGQRPDLRHEALRAHEEARRIHPRVPDLPPALLRAAQ